MKNLPIRLLVSFLFCLSIANAYTPSAYVNDNYEELFSEDLSDRAAYDTTIDEDVKVAGEDKDYLKKWEKNRAGKVQTEKKYYKTVKYATCENPDDYVCPPLVDGLVKEGYRNRINFIDLENGRISCSVLNPLRSVTTPATVKSEKAKYTKVYTNNACVKKYSVNAVENKDTSEGVKSLIKENQEFINDIKQLEYKYTVDYKQNADDEFLDLADILDGIVSFNTNLFDFEQTLLTRDLKVRDGFTVLPNETVLTKVEESWTNLFGLWDFGNEEFQENIEKQAKIRDASSIIANSSFFMLLDFWLKSNDVMVLLAQGIAFVFVSYNVLITWVMPTISNKLQKQASGENNPQRFGFGTIALIMLFSGEVDRVDIEYQSKSQDMLTTEIIVQQTNIQRAVQFLYSETNYWADAIAEIATSSYLSNLTASTGLFTDTQIEALATERIILNNLTAAYAVIDTDMCFANYNVKGLRDKLDTYRSKTNNEKEGIEGSLKINMFPKSEREAEQMMYGSRNQKDYDNLSAYNTDASSDNSGIVKSTAISKFRGSDSAPLSLSGCYNNKKNMISTYSRLAEIESGFNKLNNTTSKSAKAEYLKVINDIQWGLFAKQGYLSIAYLPATAILVDNIGIVGDLEDRKSAIEEATNEKEGAITDFATNGLKGIAEDIPLLAMFGGYQIAKMVHPVKELIMNSAGDLMAIGLGPVGRAASLIGTKFSSVKKSLTFGDSEEGEIDVIDLKIAAFLIRNVLDTTVNVVLIASAILIFTLLYIEKLFAFVASMFLLIYAFSKNQEERLTSAFAKIFAIAFKTILIVICTFLSVFSLSLVDSLQMVFIESFFQSMDMIENASWSYLGTGDAGLFGSVDIAATMITFFFKKYIFFGVTKVAFMVLKIILIANIMWKMPGFMYELIYEKVQSVSDSVGDTLQGANERQVMKV